MAIYSRILKKFHELTKKNKRSFFNYCTRYLHSACLLMRSVRWMLCTVYSWCICHYGPQVIKFEPTPAYPGNTATPLRPIFFFGLLVTVLRGFHRNNYFFFIFPKVIIISFRWKNKSKNSWISRTNSETTSGPPDATLKRSWAARILYFALRRSNKRDVTLSLIAQCRLEPNYVLPRIFYPANNKT